MHHRESGCPRPVKRCDPLSNTKAGRGRPASIRSKGLMEAKLAHGFTFLYHLRLKDSKRQRPGGWYGCTEWWGQAFIKLKSSAQRQGVPAWGARNAGYWEQKANGNFVHSGRYGQTDFCRCASTDSRRMGCRAAQRGQIISRISFPAKRLSGSVW